MNIRYRTLQNLLLLWTILVLGVAFYLQYMRGLQPCPLCIMQRFCMFLLLVFCILGVSLTGVKRSLIVTIFQILFAVAGLFFAGRQLWLQSLPVGEAPACIPDFDVLFHYFPLKDVLHALVWGTGDCAEITWRFLGLSLPVWAAFYFVIMIAGCAFSLFLLYKSFSPPVSHKR